MYIELAFSLIIFYFVKHERQKCRNRLNNHSYILNCFKKKYVDADSYIHFRHSNLQATVKGQHVLCTINRNYRDKINSTGQNHRHSF